MAANLTLDEFLNQLASQHGLHRKIRMLARYWRQVQSLPPEGRERVALALGSRAAWNRLEKLFSRDGTLSEGELAVKQALDSVGRANPGELRALARRVRSGDYAGIGKDLVDVVGKALDEEAAAAEPGTAATESGSTETEPGTAATESGSTETEPETAATEPGIRVTEPGLVATAPRVANAETEAAGEPPTAGDERWAAAGRTDSGGLAAGAPAVDRASARSELESKEPDEVGTAIEFEAEDQLGSAALPDRPVLMQPEVGAPEAPPPAAKAEPPNEPDSADETPWEGRAPEMVALSARECLAELRRLRNEVGYGAGLGPEGRVRLLQRLGSGWAGRRGLSQLIRSDSIRDVDEALKLIDRLGTPVQRTWCLGDLVEHWELRATEAARVLDAAPSPAARRRLQRRAEKHAGARA